jgi:hypothetical protein
MINAKFGNFLSKFLNLIAISRPKMVTDWQIREKLLNPLVVNLPNNLSFGERGV